MVATHEQPPADEITHGHVSTDWWVKTKTLQPSPLLGTEGSQVAQEEQQARRACPVVKGVCVWEGGCMRSFPSTFTFVTAAVGIVHVPLPVYTVIRQRADHLKLKFKVERTKSPIHVHNITGTVLLVYIIIVLQLNP